MAGDLKHELAVPALVQQTTWSRSLQWETAQNERTGGEAEVLAVGFAIGADELDGFCLAEPAL
jgi:hypothetical protein